MEFVTKKTHNVEFDFCLIEDVLSIKQLLNLINDSDIVAFDTEFTRQTTYYPILSTVQIAIKKSSGKKIIALIDAKKCSDISDVISLISNKKITKIIHASIQDLQIFHHISKQVPQNICDTQIMANFCQKKTNIGYSNLAKEILNIDICKKMQNSNWQHRPLSQEQINYALIDVIFLHEIYEFFLTKLNQNNFLESYQEEMSDFIKNVLSDNSKNLIHSFNILKLSERQIFLLNKLIIIREKYARLADIPRKHFLTDADLEFFALNFLQIDFSSYNLPQEFIDEIKGIQYLDLHDSQIRIHQKLTKNEKTTISKIKSLVAKVAKKHDFSEQFLLNNNQTKNIVRSNDIEQTKFFINHWRFNLLGNYINQILINNYENNSCELENELRI